MNIYTKKLSNIFSMLLLCGILAVTSVSCNSDDDNGLNRGDIYMDMVSLQSTGTTGTIFTFQKDDNSPEITLTTSQSFSSGSPQRGDRYVIQYIPKSGVRYESGEIEVVNIAKCYGPGFITAVSEDSWKSDALEVIGCWKTGKYLNIQTGCVFSNAPSKYELYLDPETADTDYPEFHLCFRRDFAEALITYSVFASYDISRIWDKPSCKGVVVFFNDLNGAPSTTIRKNSAVTPTPNE